MPRYFLGNVLSPTDTQPEADDPTFAFTKKEAQEIDLINIPIRMEHDEGLEVGKIVRSFQAKNGSVWVVGKVNDESLESKFAKYAIEPNPVSGTSYYTGLSLQHTHTQFANSNKTKKEAVEISLCVNPRRPDCRIVFVDKEPNQVQTEKYMYKIHKASLKTNMSSEQSKPTTEPVQTENPVVEAPVVQADSTAAPEMSREEMMRVIIEQQKEIESTTSKQSAEAEELQQLKKMIEEQKAAEQKQEADKAYALSKALIDTWAESLDSAEMDEASREAITKLAKDYPKESMAMFKVAHCASSKMKSLKKNHSETLEVIKRTQLQNRFEEVMSKKRPREDTPTEVVHAASKKPKTVAKRPAQKAGDVQSFLSAMKKFGVAGTARDHMMSMSETYHSRNRNAGGRAPFY